MINGPFHACSRMHFTSKNALAKMRYFALFVSLSVSLMSVTHVLFFIQYSNALEISYFMEILLFTLTLVNVEAISRWKGNGQGHWQRKCKKIVLLRTSSRETDRFTSNQYQDNLRPILHISSDIFSQRKRIIFSIFVCFKIVFIAQNGAPLYHLVWHTDSTPHNCIIAENWGCRWNFFARGRRNFK